MILKPMMHKSTDVNTVSIWNGASCAFNGDTCYEHLDPVWHKGYTTLHCNVKLSDSLEGDIIIENDVVKIEKKDLWVYEVSKINHGSNLVKGNIPRTIWVFGFCIKNDRL
jgi:hypothetical protein